MSAWSFDMEAGEVFAEPGGDQREVMLAIASGDQYARVLAIRKKWPGATEAETVETWASSWDGKRLPATAPEHGEQP